MASFAKGDIVRVEYASPRAIEQWMAGGHGPGPGEVGMVKYDAYQGVQQVTVDSAGIAMTDWRGTVTVEFPMLGTFGVHSSNLRLVQKAGAECSSWET